MKIPKNHLYCVFEDLRKITDKVIISFSGGKESCVVLDIIKDYFDLKTQCLIVFGFTVKNLPSQLAFLQYIEKRYGITIVERIYWEDYYLCVRSGVFCFENLNFPNITTKKIYDFYRNYFKTEWVVVGMRASDGPQRYMAVNTHGPIQMKSSVAWPLAYWKDADMMGYMARKKIFLPPEYKYMPHNFQSIRPYGLWIMREYFPSDFEEIKKVFPFADLGAERYEVDILPKKKITKGETKWAKRAMPYRDPRAIKK